MVLNTEQGPLIPYIEQLLVPRYVVLLTEIILNESDTSQGNNIKTLKGMSLDLNSLAILALKMFEFSAEHPL